MDELEAQAVDKAKAASDAAFRPAPSILNAPTAQVLLNQVDGPNLAQYSANDSLFVAKSVPIQAGKNLNIPIHVSTPGSIVEYTVQLEKYDLEFSIVAEREEGNTIVRKTERFDSSETVTQKFLVGSVPCLLQFDFNNSYSYFTPKTISYRITVTPPSRDSLCLGRRRRASACLKAVSDDLTVAQSRCSAAISQKQALMQTVHALQSQLAESKKALQIAQKEETWLQERKVLRLEQQQGLKQRLQYGWPDEKETNMNGK